MKDGKVKRQVIKTRGTVSGKLGELTKSLEQSGIETTFFSDFLQKYTGTVDYNPCLKLLSSKNGPDNFIVNSECKFADQFWRLESGAPLKLDSQHCRLADELSKSSGVWQRLERFLERNRGLGGVVLLSVAREF